jgi:hypothetical protein
LFIANADTITFPPNDGEEKNSSCLCNLSPPFSAVVFGTLHDHKIPQNNARETGISRSSVQLILEHVKWNVLHPKVGTCHEKKLFERRSALV